MRFSASVLAILWGVSAAMSGAPRRAHAPVPSRSTTFPRYTIHDLGELPVNLELAPHNTEVAAINASGQAVGTSNGRAYLWERGHMCDIGTLPGYNMASARAINRRGDMLCVAEYAGGHIDVRDISNKGDILYDLHPAKSQDPVRSFIWHDGKSILSFLPSGQARRLNANGQLLTNDGVSSLREGGPVPDATPLLQQRGRRLTALNNRGDVAGMIGWNESEQRAAAPFLYRNGRYIPLGRLDGPRVDVHGLNDRGQVVGAADAAMDAATIESYARQRQLHGEAPGTPHPQDYRLHAFLWQNGKMVDLDGDPRRDSVAWFIDNRRRILGTLPDSGYGKAVLWSMDGSCKPTVGELLQAMNDHGQWCGRGGAGIYRPNPNASMNVREHALLWDHGRIVDLSPPTATEEIATALNNRGQVVGIGEDGPFLWQSGRRITLQSLLPADSGWSLKTVTGINDRGQIVGTGKYRDHNAAFIMTPKHMTPKHMTPKHMTPKHMTPKHAPF